MTQPLNYALPENAQKLRRVGRNEWERYLRDLDPAELAPDAGRAAEAGGRTKGIAFLLATYGKPDGTSIYPSVKLLAEAIGLADRQTRTHLGRLRQAGLIRRVRRGSNLGTRNAADLYELTCPPTHLSASGDSVPVATTNQRQRGARGTGIRQPANTSMNTRSHPPDPPSLVPPRTGSNVPAVPTSIDATWERWGIPSDDRPVLWLRIWLDPQTRHPVSRAQQQEWVRQERALLVAQQKSQRLRRLATLERTQPECEHGVAAGLAPAPRDGLPICSTCRRESREPKLVQLGSSCEVAATPVGTL